MGCSASNQAQPVSISSQSPTQRNRPQPQERVAEAGPSDELKKIQEEPAKDAAQSATSTTPESTKPSPAGIVKNHRNIPRTCFFRFWPLAFFFFANSRLGIE